MKMLSSLLNGFTASRVNLALRMLLYLTATAQFAGPAGASPFKLGPLVDLSDPDVLAGCGSNGAEKETRLAVNPTNPKNVVATWWGGLAKGVVAAVSFDGGRQWQ